MVSTRSQEKAKASGSSGGRKKSGRKKGEKGKSGRKSGAPPLKPLKRQGPRRRSPSHLYLCIQNSSALRYTHSVPSIHHREDVLTAYTASARPGNGQGYLDLLEGELAEFEHFTGNEHSQWLIDVAHGLCDPRHKRGLLWVWDSNGQDSLVNPGDPLRALVYEYRVPVPIRLTKISHRQSKSVTDTLGAGGTMRSDVLSRDGNCCWISGVKALSLIKSHACPKRMGNAQSSFIYEEFTGTAPPPGLTIYNPRFGISLSRSVDFYFGLYRIGLKPSDGLYVAHDFSGENLNIIGLPVPQFLVPVLHGHPVSPPNPVSPINPPAGILWWHYIQCVISKFGCYKGQRNITHYEEPIPMEDDSDLDGDDDDFSWPTAQFDRGRMMTKRIEQETEKMSEIANWVNA
ncbi:hypothetical protein BT96DRAFT_824181 [Gymnopus androsaceus JB14]|uniref:Uncharacterized protein n=1 Tax=Gymnopus androsaceus JB14 TaxID=1447944 RepID=A0A6A4HEI0_9AGAR|nr:hypothetical protein BT96DRAFT_824181 [Gymnopus androsaceus JB14]